MTSKKTKATEKTTKDNTERKAGKKSKLVKSAKYAIPDKALGLNPKSIRSVTGENSFKWRL